MSTFTPEKIIIHHAADDDSPALEWGAIRKWHIEHNGWLDCGYHAGAERIGDYYEILIGRPWTMAGAHTIGENWRALGLCFVGNFEITAPPAEQLAVGAKLVRWWMTLFKIPIAAIFKHSDFYSTLCPGRLFPWVDFIEMLK